ncbi:MAG TPA: DEAD/DEAH box helicase [Gemmatimonadaceae bacterium]|nr:DEAD/DEAH box helicase [Gemmatimonadaceae bacterium]
MENEQESAAATGGVSRGQNQLHVTHADWTAAARIIEPLLDRAAPGAATQLLIVTPDTEAAAGIGERLGEAVSRRDLRVLAASSARRGTRAYREAVPDVLLADADTLAALLQSATLKLDGVKAVVLAWVDDAPAANASLETVMTEVPKDAARVILAASVTAEVEALVERYARRPRRVNAEESDSATAVSLSFVNVMASGRPAALRRLLDAVDPEKAQVLVRDAAAGDAVRSLLRALGYGAEGAAIRVVSEPEPGADLLVLYDVPESASALRSAVAARTGGRVIALVAPRQVQSLRRMAGGTVAPFPLPEAATRARSREDSVRDELRSVLESGQASREVLALEPLLTDFDAVEIAAAALRLLEAERAKAKEPPSPDAPRAMTRLYVNLGGMDEVRPGDLVGAITNEAGVARAEVGRVDVRERHSTVEVATPIANAVVAKLTGVTIRNRRVIARVDEGPPSDRGDRPAHSRRDDDRRPRRDDDRRPRRDDSRGARGSGGARGPRSGGTRGRMGSSDRPPTSPGARGKR